MQRSLLALALLLLAAVGVVAYAVLSTDTPQPVDVGGPDGVDVRPADAGTRPPPPIDLSGDPAARGPSGDPADGTRTAAAPTSAEAFANELTGLVIDEQGRAVAECRVELGGAPARVLGPIAGAARALARQTTTDAEGRYAFASLEPRDHYLLRFVHADYARLDVLSTPVGEAGRFVEPTVTLHDGASLHGRVTSQGSGAIVGATLHLDSPGAQYAPTPPADRLTATSREDGTYAIGHVPEGARVLTVSAPGFGTLTVQNLTFDGQRDVERDVELGPGFAIAGRVMEKNGGPIEGATVQALGLNAAMQSARIATTSGPDGRFRLDGLARGAYNVIATLRGFGSSAAARAEGGAQDVQLQLVRQARICGRVVDAESGAPVPRFELVLRSRADFEGGPSVPLPDTRTIVEDANGEYCIPGVQALENGYVVEARAEGYAPCVSQPVEIRQGESLTGVLVRLGHGGSIRGRITDAAGKGVPGRVSALPDEMYDLGFLLDPEAGGGRGPVRVRTDAEGRFLVANLAPGAYLLDLRAQGFARGEHGALTVTDGAVTEAGDLALPLGGAVEGRVTDAAGQAAPGAEVVLETADEDRIDRYRTKSDAQGAYVLEHVLSGRYRIYAAGPQGSLDARRVFEGSQFQTISVIEGERTRTDLSLPR